MVTAVEGSAVLSAAQASRTVLRAAQKARQRAARALDQGRLQAAWARVEALEDELRACQQELAEQRRRSEAAAAQAVALANGPKARGQALQEELVARLALAVPVVEGVLAHPVAAEGGKDLGLPRVVVSRRNVGMHCARQRGASIQRLTQPELNRLQRRPRRTSGRKKGSGIGGARHRRLPELRTPAEAVAEAWSVARGMGRATNRNGEHLSSSRGHITLARRLQS